MVEPLKGLKSYTSPAIDELQLRPKLLCEVREEIGEVLAQIFYKAMQNVDVPQEWKDALIVPLIKKGNRSDPCNYRPVCLTLVMEGLSTIM